MQRLLIVVALIVFVAFAMRRARRLARSGAAKGSGRSRPGAPEQLVCGVCGTAFEPDKSGWICPKCGK